MHTPLLLLPVLVGLQPSAQPYKRPLCQPAFLTGGGCAFLHVLQKISPEFPGVQTMLIVRRGWSSRELGGTQFWQAASAAKLGSPFHVPLPLPQGHVEWSPSHSAHAVKNLLLFSWRARTHTRTHTPLSKRMLHDYGERARGGREGGGAVGDVMRRHMCSSENWQNYAVVAYERALNKTSPWVGT